MSYHWATVLVYASLAMAVVVVFYRQHRRHQRTPIVDPELRRRTLAYLQMLDELHEIEYIPSPLSRAQAIAEAQERYFATVQARRAS